MNTDKEIQTGAETADARGEKALFGMGPEELRAVVEGLGLPK